MSGFHEALRARRHLPLALLTAVILVAFGLSASPTSAATAPGRSPGVSMVATPNGNGWWTADAAGNVTAGGDATYYGSAGNLHLNQPIVGITTTPDGHGYWLVASDGGIFTYGDAKFYGSAGNLHLNQPIVGITTTPDGHGYWLVASDGGIFTYGDAQFYGSAGNLHLNQPIVGITTTPDGHGYWLVASDGGIFTYGDAQFYGSAGNLHLNQPTVGITTTPDGHGYWLVASDGGIFSFGDATYYGSDPTSASSAVAIHGLPSGGYVVLRATGPETFGPTASAAEPAPVPEAQPPAGAGGPQVAPVAADPASGGVTVRDGKLYLNGQPWQFVGINAPQAATDYSVNAGCGAAIDLAQLFDSLPANSVVRVGFGQDAAINAQTGARDWSGLDRVVAAAEESPTHPRLIVGLSSQSGQCDGGAWKGDSWYQGGYNQPLVAYTDGLPRVSFWQWIQQVVTRYASSPAILMWEPVGEPEASNCDAGYTGTGCYGHTVCPSDAAQTLRHFFDVVGAEIKQLDPNHLVGSGQLGGDQCGWAGTGAGSGGLLIDASPGIDVVTYHDYGSDSDPMPPWLAQRIQEARTLGKPIVDEEVGIDARDTQSATSTETRALELTAKMQAAFAAGVSGFLPWAYGQVGPVGCDYYILPNDPIWPDLVAPS